MLVWSDTSVAECPGCGATIIVGILSVCATCKIDGFFYVDLDIRRGWYASRAAFERGDSAICQTNPMTTATGDQME